MSRDTNRDPDKEQDKEQDVDWGRETTDENRIILTTKTIAGLVVGLVTATVTATVFIVTGYYDLKNSQSAMQSDIAAIRQELKNQNLTFWSVPEMREYGAQMKELNADFQPHPLKIPSVFEVRTALGK